VNQMLENFCAIGAKFIFVHRWGFPTPRFCRVISALMIAALADGIVNAVDLHLCREEILKFIWKKLCRLQLINNFAEQGAIGPRVSC